jgi:hypothetical protein
VRTITSVSVGSKNFVHEATRVRSEPDYLALFDMTLVLTVGLAMFELAVELLSVDTLTAAGALIAGVASWTICACCAGVFLRGSPWQLYFLCMAGLAANLLILFSGIVISVFGLCLYTTDCLGKCAVVMLALQMRTGVLSRSKRGQVRAFTDIRSTGNSHSACDYFPRFTLDSKE